MSAVEHKVPVVASIVLYQHKQEDIQPTIDSLLAEPLVETIVLVDNAGSEWASQLNNPRIAYIKSDFNGGYGHGHNQAMSKYLSKCKYFIICNPDIEFSAGTVKICITLRKAAITDSSRPRLFTRTAKLSASAVYCRLPLICSCADSFLFIQVSR